MKSFIMHIQYYPDLLIRCNFCQHRLCHHDSSLQFFHHSFIVSVWWWLSTGLQSLVKLQYWIRGHMQLWYNIRYQLCAHYNKEKDRDCNGISRLYSQVRDLVREYVAEPNLLCAKVYSFTQMTVFSTYIDIAYVFIIHKHTSFTMDRNSL